MEREYLLPADRPARAAGARPRPRLAGRARRSTSRRCAQAAAHAGRPARLHHLPLVDLPGEEPGAHARRARDRARCRRGGREYRFRLRARSFLHNQVRGIVGTLERVGARRLAAGRGWPRRWPRATARPAGRSARRTGSTSSRCATRRTRSPERPAAVSGRHGAAGRRARLPRLRRLTAPPSGLVVDRWPSAKRIRPVALRAGRRRSRLHRSSRWDRSPGPGRSAARRPRCPRSTCRRASVILPWPGALALGKAALVAGAVGVDRHRLALAQTVHPVAVVGHSRRPRSACPRPWLRPSAKAPS